MNKVLQLISNLLLSFVLGLGGRPIAFWVGAAFMGLLLPIMPMLGVILVLMIKLILETVKLIELMGEKKE